MAYKFKVPNVSSVLSSRLFLPVRLSNGNAVTTVHFISDIMMSNRHLLIFLLIFAACDIRAENRQDLYIYGADEPVYLPSSHPVHYDYSIKWTQLPSKVNWDPVTQDFPLEIGAEVRRAADSQKWQTVLQFIRIERLQIPAGLLDENSKLVNITNEWFVVFGFSKEEDTTGEIKFVVSLLDGTYAKEVPRFMRTGTRFADTLNSDSRDRSQPSYRKEIFNATRTVHTNDVFASLSSPALRISSIQWDPLAGRFPLDLKKAVGDAKDYILTQANTDSADLIIKRIAISRFLPEAAVAAKQLSIGDHLHHWVLEFEFSRTGKSDASYRLKMLLDGRIIGGQWVKGS